MNRVNHGYGNLVIIFLITAIQPNTDSTHPIIGYMAKLGEITGKTRVLYSELGEITRVLPFGMLGVIRG